MRNSNFASTLEACSGLACNTMVEDLVRGISGGNLTRNARLPSEQELAQKYAISVTSVRRGMEVLVRNGFLARRRGSGTYVNGLARKGAPAAPRADTILICRGVVHTASHPFFGHIYPALYTRLAELGWQVKEYHDGNPDHEASQVSFTRVDPGALAEVLRAESSVAGLVLHRVTDEVAALVRQSGHPCVAIGETPGLPWVDYDWDLEFIRAISLVLNAGARRVWAINSLPDGDERRCIRAAKAMAKGADAAVITLHRCPPSGVYSQVIYNAYEATRSMLHADGPRYDGIAIGSDFQTQGVLDALAEAGIVPGKGPVIAAKINKESQIHSNLPFTALVADGAATGKAAAELLHERITNPAGAADGQYLSCTIRLRSRNPS